MRQFRCIDITLNDALLLRDAVRPLARVDPYDQFSMIRLCQKLYGAILKLKANRLDSINLPLEEHEAMIINHFVGGEDWQNARAILEQTWLALYELQHEATYPRAREEIGVTIERIKGQTAQA